MLSESRTTEDISDVELAVDGYVLLRCDSYSRKTGGVVIYLLSDINYIVLKNINIDKCWFLAVRVIKGFKQGVYGVLYK
jgi:hypothetical protein